MKRMKPESRRKIARIIAIIVVIVMVLAIIAPFVGTGAFANM